MVFLKLLFIYFNIIINFKENTDKNKSNDFDEKEEVFDNIWNLITGKKYLVRAFLYENGNLITVTEDLKINVHISIFF